LPLEWEINGLLWLVGILCLGFLGGIRRAVFLLFTYNVSLKMIMGEYEKSFSENAQSSPDFVTLSLGLVMTAIGVVEIVGISPMGH
jgi:cell division protein FtsX